MQCCPGLPADRHHSWWQLREHRLNCGRTAQAAEQVSSSWAKLHWCTASHWQHRAYCAPSPRQCQANSSPAKMTAGSFAIQCPNPEMKAEMLCACTRGRWQHKSHIVPVPWAHCPNKGRMLCLCKPHLQHPVSQEVLGAIMPQGVIVDDEPVTWPQVHQPPALQLPILIARPGKIVAQEETADHCLGICVAAAGATCPHLHDPQSDDESQAVCADVAVSSFDVAAARAACTAPAPARVSERAACAYLHMQMLPGTSLSMLQLAPHNPPALELLKSAIGWASTPYAGALLSSTWVHST